MNFRTALAPHTMRITDVGMAPLRLGLIFAIFFEITRIDPFIGYVPAVGVMPPTYVVANILWILGALILIIPPLVEGVEILVVLEIFLVASGFMSFWQPELFVTKFVTRISMSLIAACYLKERGLLPDFNLPWSLIDPRYYYRSWKKGDNGALTLGIETLGVGYALSQISLLTVGSAFLWRSAHVGFKETGKPILRKWSRLNMEYTLAGLIIIIAQTTYFVIG